MSKIVTRDGWKARPPGATTPRSLNQIQGVCYHHSAGEQPSRFKTGAAVVRGLQAYHMDSRGYADIAYNALIGPAGQIYAGRNIAALGAHSDGEWQGASANRVLLGICFLGDFTGRNRLTPKAQDAALTLEYLWSMKLGRPLAFATHRETKATACPGDDVQAWIDRRRVS